MSDANVRVNENKNAWIYAILLIFLGWLGIHRFYLNKNGTGILYLFTGGILGVGLLIDSIVSVFFLVKDAKGDVISGAKSLRIISLITTLLFGILLFTIFTTLL